jgi:hypothetical protein
MFRALDALKKDTEGFESSPHSDYVQKQTVYFNQTLPQQFPSGIPTTDSSSPSSVLANALQGLTSWDPNTRQAKVRDINVKNYATSVQVSQELLDSHNRCKTATLDELLNTENSSSKLRCGWIYQKGDTEPRVSQGALGTRKGPAGFVESPPGKWFWNLEDAKKEILSDRCSRLTDCKQVGSSSFAECGFSTQRGMGLPVDRNGNLLYPKDARLSGAGIVLNPNQCPPPPVVGSPAYERARSVDICTPLPDGRLSRDCMIQQVVNAGCKQDGRLYTALINQAQPRNYGAGLTNDLSYKKYQELAPQPILDSVLRDGSATVSVALGNFKSLAEVSSVERNTALSFAARDLCIQKGVMDTFDFCTELNDLSRAPFALDCLQSAFRNAGGQPAGSEYPTATNKAAWDGLGSWRTVKDRIQTLKAQIQSTDERVQREALIKFLGITREAYPLPQIRRITGIEVFWFNRSNNSFIGRRITTGSGADFPRMSTGGVVEDTGLADMVEYLSIVNLRPMNDESIRLRLETDDGILYTKDKNLDPSLARNSVVDTADTFGANWAQPPTGYNQKNCWNLRKGGPNYILGYWWEQGGGAHSQVYYTPCSGGNTWARLPSSWMTLTQEPNAPMLSWQKINKDGTIFFQERRMAYFMNLITSGTQIVPTGLQLINNSFAETNRLLAMNSWRTLTCLFTAEQNSTSSVLFTLGPLSVGIQGTNLSVRFQSASIQVDKTFSNVLSLSANEPNYLFINMRSDFEGKFPNRVTIAVGKAAQFVNGSINVGGISPNVASYTTVASAPLYASNDAFKLQLGHTGRSATAKAIVRHLRLFDYELASRETIRDIQDTWEMQFF